MDVSDDLDPMAAHEYLDIIRDRVPIRFKNTLYFGKQCFRIIFLYIFFRLGRISIPETCLSRGRLLEHSEKLDFGLGEPRLILKSSRTI